MIYVCYIPIMFDLYAWTLHGQTLCCIVYSSQLRRVDNLALSWLVHHVADMFQEFIFSLDFIHLCMWKRPACIQYNVLHSIIIKYYSIPN